MRLKLISHLHILSKKNATHRHMYAYLRFELGQWAMERFRSLKKSSSLSLRCTPWATLICKQYIISNNTHTISVQPSKQYCIVYSGKRCWFFGQVSPQPSTQCSASYNSRHPHDSFAVVVARTVGHLSWNMLFHCSKITVITLQMTAACFHKSEFGTFP